MFDSFMQMGTGAALALSVMVLGLVAIIIAAMGDRRHRFDRTLDHDEKRANSAKLLALKSMPAPPAPPMRKR